MRAAFGQSAAARAPRIYVYPTRFGLGFALAAILTLIGCINYALSLGYALTFLLLAVWIVSAAHASHAQVGVRLELRPPDTAYAGGEAVFVVLARQAGAQAKPGLRVRAGGAVARLDLPAGGPTHAGEARGELPIPASRRGPLPVQTARLEASDPLGLWRACSYWDPPVQALVYPAPEADPPPFPEAQPGPSGAGARRARGDDDFAGLREYAPGDPLRRVAWRRAAGGGPLSVKQFDAPASATLALRWDQTRALRDPEARLSRLAAWVRLAERAGTRFGLSLPGGGLAPGSGEAHARQALRLLALHALPPAPVPRPGPWWRRS